MLDYRGGNDVGPLGVSEVGSPRNDKQAAVFDLGRDLFQHGRRGGRVVGAGDRQGGRGDRRQIVAQVEDGDRLATAGVALGGSGGNHRRAGRPDVGVSGQVGGGETALPHSFRR